MCFPADPLTIALALTAVGSGAEYIGNEKAQKAQRGAQEAERIRQKGMEAQQNALFEGQLARTANVPGQGVEDAIASRRAAFMQALEGRSPTQDALPGSGSADSAIAANQNRVVGEQRGESAQQADALARLTGLQQSLFDTNLLNNRDEQQVRMIGGNRLNSARVLPLELQAAARKGAGLRAVGGIAKQVGMSMLGGQFMAGAGLGTGTGVSMSQMYPATAQAAKLTKMQQALQQAASLKGGIY